MGFLARMPLDGAFLVGGFSVEDFLKHLGLPVVEGLTLEFPVENPLIAVFLIGRSLAAEFLAEVCLY